ncbi:MAG TPA: hypothetical protein VHS96_12990, partial [Bacteroidia bacterium]|nr:hypothetical protein [Bacteroidia bacterium]
MSSDFSRFENFGTIADAPTRKKIAGAVYAHLASGGKTPLTLSPKETEQFADALKKISNHATLLELCGQDESLAKEVTEEILGFVNATKRVLKTSENPFAEEQTLQEKLVQVQPKDFAPQWKPIAQFLQDIYAKREIDPDFYTSEFAAALGPKDDKKTRRSFESVKAHLGDRWQAHLTQKELAHELALIEQERAKFVKDLYARAEELQKLKEALAPFTQELGRLWDMSKGNWQRVNFDLLKQYAALLQQNEALQALAEMLGKMRKAETELEQELYKDVEIKTVWKVE